MFDILASKVFAQWGAGGVEGVRQGVEQAQQSTGGGGNRGGFNLGTFDNMLNPIRTGRDGFENIIGNLISIFLIVIALAAFIFLLIAGFNYVTAGGDTGKAEKARTGILNAVIGIIIVLLAFSILQFVTGGLGGRLFGR